MQGVFARAANRVVAAVDYEGDAPLFEACVEQRAVAITKRMIEDGAGQPVMLHKNQRMLQRVRRRQRGTSRFERLRNVHDDQRFILNDED